MDNIKEYLLAKQKEIDKQLKSVGNNDPLFVETVAGASELGTAVWESEVHTELEVKKNNLAAFSKGIQRSLEKFKMGTYGICENCGEAIEEERLKVFPTALSCIPCATSNSKTIKLY